VRRRTLGDADGDPPAMKFTGPAPEAADDKVVVRRRRSSLKRATTLGAGSSSTSPEKDKSQRRSRTIGDDAPTTLPQLQSQKEPEPSDGTDDGAAPSEEILMALKQEKTPRDVNNVAELARKWALGVSEVKAVIAGFRAADHGTGRVSAEDMRAVFAKTDWGAKVSDEIIYAAWRAIAELDNPPSPPAASKRSSVSAAPGNHPKIRRMSGRLSGGVSKKMSTNSGTVMWVAILEKFLEWYRANCFGAISAANQSNKDAMTYDLASDNQVPPQTIDKLRKRFDEFDTDGSGYIDFEEFGVMFCQLLKVKDPSNFSGSRMKRFWQEIDVDGSGEVEFEEFCNWYLKYFSSDGYMLPSSVDGGIIGQFYSSFQPSAARRNSLAANDDYFDGGLECDDFAQIQKSLR
jgi:hypothetical protein